jgi:hypothetical protein
MGGGFRGRQRECLIELLEICFRHDKSRTCQRQWPADQSNEEAIAWLRKQTLHKLTAD